MTDFNIFKTDSLLKRNGKDRDPDLERLNQAERAADALARAHKERGEAEERVIKSGEHLFKTYVKNGVDRNEAASISHDVIQKGLDGIASTESEITRIAQDLAHQPLRVDDHRKKKR